MFVRGPRRDQSGDLGVLVIDLQHRANALEREAHIDVKIFGAARREVVGVRIVLLGQRVGVNLKHILRVVLIQPVQLILIAAGQGVGYFLTRLVCQLQAERLIFKSLAPALIKLIAIGCPGHGGMVND